MFLPNNVNSVPEPPLPPSSHRTVYEFDNLSGQIEQGVNILARKHIQTDLKFMPDSKARHFATLTTAFGANQ
jgi:hypothetical protein